MLRRDPIPPLRPFVKTLWAVEPCDRAQDGACFRERVLPTGDMHLVFRSSAHSLRILDGPDDCCGHAFGHALVGGARANGYLREVMPGGASVGAQLRHGVCVALFSAPADELAGRHTMLDDLWGEDASLACERIFSARDAARQLDAFEAILVARLPRVRGLHPAVSMALARFRESPDVNVAVAASGYSHRHFIELFARETGLTPKRFCRVRRFRKLLADVATRPTASWTELALAGGYSDQAHFSHEFRAFAGITPREYRRSLPRFPHHVPLLSPAA